MLQGNDYVVAHDVANLVLHFHGKELPSHLGLQEEAYKALRSEDTRDFIGNWGLLSVALGEAEAISLSGEDGLGADMLFVAGCFLSVLDPEKSQRKENILKIAKGIEKYLIAGFGSFPQREMLNILSNMDDEGIARIVEEWQSK